MRMVFLLTLIVSLALNFTLFLIAYNRQTDKLTDLAYSISFVTITLLTLAFSANRSVMLIAAAALVCIWAFRLGGFLVYRISKTGRDRRFDTMRTSFFGFLGFWLIQAVIAWVLLLPLMLLSSTTGTFTATSGLGFVIWAIGLAIEAIADWQKFVFRRSSSNHDKWIDTGLWRYSRHPNYFGEILVWVGIYVFVVPSLTTLAALLALISPLAITLTLCFFSGIPLLEASAMKKWGDNPHYLTYKKRTSVLVPLPRRQP